MRPSTFVGGGLVAASLLSALGCHGTVGGVLANSTNTLVLPAVMQTGDVGIGCATGEGLGAMIAAYAPYSKKAERASIVSTLSAGMCLEDDVWEAELLSSRALRVGDVEAAKDARTVAARLHHEAANRYHAAFDLLTSGYGIPDEGEDCPKLRKTSDQLTYLLGLSSGLLAIMHNSGAQGTAGVPLTIPSAVERGAACLDNDTWWGAPEAMPAVLGVLQPDKPGVGDPWATLDASAAKGRAAGVRLAGSFLVQAAASVGDEARLKDAIRAHAASRAETPTDPTWAMLDRYSTLLVRQESDVLWTTATGHRTPHGELGTFADDPVDEPVIDEGLLGDLLGDLTSDTDTP